MKILKKCPVCQKEHNKKIFCSNECRRSKKGCEIINRKAQNTLMERRKDPIFVEKILQKRKATLLKNYGVDSIIKIPYIKQKAQEQYQLKIKEINQKKKDTSLKNYGVDNPSKSPIVKEKIKNKNLAKYGVTCNLHSKDGIEKCKNTWNQKYGVDHPFKSNVVKENIKKTMIERYGVSHPFKSDVVKEKFVNTNLRKYGVKYACQSEKIKNKIKETCLKRYGVKCHFQSEEVKNNIKSTNLKKYGFEYHSQAKEWQNKIFKKYFLERLNTFNDVEPNFDLEHYFGTNIKYEWKCKKCNRIFNHYIKNGIIPICKKCNPPLQGTSKPEIELQNWLEQHIPIERNKRYFENGKYKYELDIFVPLKNIGIEFNGLYSHSEIRGKKTPIYHFKKSEYFLNKNIHVIHIWEHEWYIMQTIIKSLIFRKLDLIQNKIDSNNCILKEISLEESNNFLEKNHIQGSCNSNKQLGLFYNQELVSVMALKDNEILRYEDKLNLEVIGSFEKFLKEISESATMKIDRRFSNGELLLTNHGFRLIDVEAPRFFLTFSGTDRIWDCGQLIFELE